MNNLEFDKAVEAMVKIVESYNLTLEIVSKGYIEHILLLKSIVPENMRKEYEQRLKNLKGNFVSDNYSKFSPEFLKHGISIIENIFSLDISHAQSD